ncbi:hypothetical protein SCALM49S_04662 [Streptomyces californicus]
MRECKSVLGITRVESAIAALGVLTSRLPRRGGPVLADILVRAGSSGGRSPRCRTPAMSVAAWMYTDGEPVARGFIEASVRWNTFPLSEVDKVKAGRRLT